MKHFSGLWNGFPGGDCATPLLLLFVAMFHVKHPIKNRVQLPTDDLLCQLLRGLRTQREMLHVEQLRIEHGRNEFVKFSFDSMLHVERSQMR